MKKITFNIRTNEGKLERRQGYAVELPEYPDLKLAVCKHNAVIAGGYEKVYWSVDELQTGGRWLLADTRKAAVQEVKDYIEKRGIAFVMSIIETAVVKCENLYGKAAN